MTTETAAVQTFLQSVHPYDALPQDELARVVRSFGRRELAPGTVVYEVGDELEGLFLVETGQVEILDSNGALVSILGPRNSFGERGLMRDGRAATTARTTAPTRLLVLPAGEFHRLVKESPAFARFFDRGGGGEPRGPDLATRSIAELMTPDPATCTPEASAAEAARQMRDRRISCLGVTDRQGRLVGIVTTRDLSNRVVAEGRPADTPVADVMTPDPVALPPTALGTDILHLMVERRIGHVPVVRDGRMIGIVTQTDLTRQQAITSASLIRDIARADSIDQMRSATARIPHLLRQLVGAQTAHEITTRLITDIADAVTRRLITMAEAELGPAPAPYLWLACGSQGRQEQTGVSDQDNCLMIDDSVSADDMAWYERLARFVSDGLNACGYVYCPGDMMATNPRWRQPVRVWRDYFLGWIATPSTEAQMLASVMFDLRPIGGDAALFEGLQAETLDAASRNSIFVAHMISNALKHTPPLGLIRGFATIRSGEHRNTIDMKHSGVVPVVDLARIYALKGRLRPVNTRARLLEAIDAGIVSPAGGRDLLAAYDLIAQTRLNHQAAQIRAGEKPDNYLAPSRLSDFERSHLRNAFVVVRTMQSALGHGKGMLE